MTAGELIDKVDLVKVNGFDEELKLSWLNELKAKIKEEVIDTHEKEIYGGEPLYHVYDSEADEDLRSNSEIEMPAAHMDVFEYWLYAKIDLANSDLERYSNSLVIFNNAYSDYKKWYHRNHMPLGVM